MTHTTSPRDGALSDVSMPSSTGRIASLLGLRGIAALVVVIHHCMLRFPIFTSTYSEPAAVPSGHPIARLMVHTPLHLVWAGGEAVFVFFVLSGLVLTLPVLRSAKFRWIAYYPARLIRLYLPVWVAIAWALSLFLLTRSIDPAAGAAWTSERGTTIDVRQLIERSIFLHDSNFYNGPLWSIVWEVLFSLLLPLYILVIVRFRIGWGWKLAASLAATTVGAYLRSSHPPIGNLLLFMSMFAVGVLMAAHLDDLRTLAEQIARSRRPNVVWNLVLAVSLLGLCAYWFALLTTDNKHFLDMTDTVQLVGAAGLVFVVIFDRRLRRALEAKVVLLLGTVSFSLYLVHDPIIAMIDYLGGSRAIDFLVGIPVSIAIATTFFWLVERPSHKLARWVARTVPSR